MTAPATARELMIIWTRIGLQSFGGGQAVQLYAYEDLVHRRGWISPDGWNEIWGTCQVVPGINVIAFAALSGHRLAGWSGMAGSAAGLVIPSIIITIAVAAAYQRWQGSAIVRGAVRGLVLASVGASLVMSYRFIHPALRAGRREGWPSVAAALFCVLGGAGLAAWGRVPALAILVGSGALMALVLQSIGHASPAPEDRP